jgi:hypothetical protein
MNVPWGWIKQRPHFLAESLMQDFDVEIFFKHPLVVPKKNLVNETDNRLKIKGFYQIPFSKIPILKYFSFLEIINRYLASTSLPDVNQYNYVWVTSIATYRVIRNLLLPTTKLIYDCMDDELSFTEIIKNKKLLKRNLLTEIELIKRSNIVFCSSEYLSTKIQERTRIKRKITIINNAIHLPQNLNMKVSTEYKEIAGLENSFIYIGMVSDWFDFDLIIKTLDDNPSMNVVIVGPLAIEKISHPRLHYIGAIPHNRIFEIMSIAKVLIMPFKVNELICSVNPVKIYEYIFMDKIVIAPKYGESKKFEDYIYLYDNANDFGNLVKKILDNQLKPKRRKQENIEFAINNQWSNRYQEVKKQLIL